jgi:hypothetical protein
MNARIAAGERTYPEQPVERLAPVLHMHDPVGEVALGQRPHSQLGVARIVLDEENVHFLLGGHLVLPPLGSVK